VTTLTNLEEDGRGLNEIRTAKLMENAVYFFDGSGSTTSTPQSGSSTNSAIRSRGTTDTTR
jgi:hypothetical protein